MEGFGERFDEFICEHKFVALAVYFGAIVLCGFLEAI